MFNEFVASVLKSRSLDMRIGIAHALGADPRTFSKAGYTMGFLGRELLFSSNDPMGMPSLKITTTKPTLMERLTPGLSLIGTLGSAVSGYSENGLVGAGRALIVEASLNASLVKHGYNKDLRGGVSHLTPGRITNAKFLSKFGTPGKVAAGALNLGDYLGRYYWGSALGASASSILGGGMLGTAGAMIGGSLGVRHAGKLTAAAGMYYMGKTVAMGSYSVLKAGYSHQQMRKVINTDGDMVAFMTQGAHTMRERAVQAIAKSHLNARSALGMEASLFHQVSKSYTSPYRRY